MKKVLKLVKGKRDERRECGGVTPSQSGELLSPARTQEDEGLLGVENGYGYNIEFGGKDKTLTKLHKAAWQGNLDKLKSALKKVDVDAVDRHNRTALHFAVAQGHPNIVWFLLGNNAKTFIGDDEGHTPLLKAIECGHRECMTLLLDRGANVNVADYNGNTGLHMAVTRASFDTASSLLKRDADTDVANNAGDYPLHIATRLENKDLVDLLLGAGAFVDVLDRENRTPLMLAAKTGNRVLAQLFVEQGAQLTVVDSNGWTAQDYAMLGGHEGIASWLSSCTHEEPRAKSEQPPSPSNISCDPGENLDNILDKCSAQEVPRVRREKHQDSGDSPEAEDIPPYCRPPRSWEMIQAGMIDEKKDGSEPKRRSITALGTLHFRKESFTDPSASSPKSTLSLNRRRTQKDRNTLAKNRLSLNEEESLTHWWHEGNAVSRDPGHSTSDSDWDSSVSPESRRGPRKAGLRSMATDSAESRELDVWSGDSGSGTLGRQGTMREVEELWFANPHATPEGQSQEEKPPTARLSEGGSPHLEKTFPPPPTGLELGVDMARSIKCLKGLSLDQSSASFNDRNIRRSAYESHSLDCLDERDVAQVFRSHTGPHGDQASKEQKPANKMADMSRRISEQLECYDQALRELAGTQNYYSLPCKGGSREDWRRRSCGEQGGESQWREALKWEFGKEGSGMVSGTSGRVEKRRKKHMLLAMREVRHGGESGNDSRTSVEEQVLSPVRKAEEGLELEDKGSPKGGSSGSGGNSPADENPFFGVGRQETVLERNDDGRESEESETGEESTLWLQDEGQKLENSDEDVAEIAADEGSKQGEAFSFSPLGIIQREMEEESRERGRPKPLCGENEDQNEEVVGEPSPDVSLSSGPIEPLGAEKDSGSEAESSHNDVSPPHSYALRSQHEWLKSHLKATTSEKNKLEELMAQLTEKAERLQYELADAKEAGKSRDEVIRLLQGQLARMEAAYTKSLEESVQSRLQLTSHEQEILHLKELCYRYQEEKEAATSGAGGDFLQNLQLRIKVLEEEREKMREEINNLEAEKALLEGRLRASRQGESEMAEQCQWWKERCRELEETVKSYVSKEAAKRGEQELELERKLAFALEEKVELKAKVESLEATMERGRRKFRGTEKEKRELMAELKRRNAEMESELKRVEELWERKVKKKEEEMREEIRGSSVWGKESEELRQLVQRLEEQVEELQEKKEVNRAGGDASAKEQLEGMGRENVKLKREVEELKAKLLREGSVEEAGMGAGAGGDVREELLCEKRAVRIKSKAGGRAGSRGQGEKEGCVAVRKQWGGGAGGNVLGEIGGRCEQSVGGNEIVQDLEYLELKKQILSLESKMSIEKNLRHLLENEMIKMRVSLSEKEKLEMEVDSLKKKVRRQWLGKSGMELLEYERNLQAKRESYLTGMNDVVDENNDHRAKCQLLAKEREKSKQLTKTFRPTPKTFLGPFSSPPSSLTLHSYSYLRPRLLLLHAPQLPLHPHLKNDLDYQLHKTIHRYIQESPSTLTIPPAPI